MDLLSAAVCAVDRARSEQQRSPPLELEVTREIRTSAGGKNSENGRKRVRRVAAENLRSSHRGETSTVVDANTLEKITRDFESRRSDPHRRGSHGHSTALYSPSPGQAPHGELFYPELINRSIAIRSYDS